MDAPGVPSGLPGIAGNAEEPSGAPGPPSGQRALLHLPPRAGEQPPECGAGCWTSPACTPPVGRSRALGSDGTERCGWSPAGATGPFVNVGLSVRPRPGVGP